MHPQGQFCGGDAEPGIWKEVSVGGGVYTLRESRSAQQKGKAVSIDLSVTFYKSLFLVVYTTLA